MMKRGWKVAVVGAGIYGTTIAIELARKGHRVTLFDPLGILCAASVINQYRIHRGYHYPRSPETIAEILEARDKFIEEYREAVVNGIDHYYAIPFHGSKTAPQDFEKICKAFALPLEHGCPEWMNFNFIDKCYRVVEDLYDPQVLRTLIIKRVQILGIVFKEVRFHEEFKADFDFIVYATYGISGNNGQMFDSVQIQVAEKILIQLPSELAKKSLVVIDGPFTGFDPYGNTECSLFGSAKYTNHWVTFDPRETIPPQYEVLLNGPKFEPVPFTHFNEMINEAALAVPLALKSIYIGSRFTLRVVEYNPPQDRRILHISQSDGKTFQVFSGKVVSAVKAAEMIGCRITNA